MDSEESDHDYFGNEKETQKHGKLVKNVISLNKTPHLTTPSRTEATIDISEFSLGKTGTGEQDSIKITDLTKSLKGKKSHLKLGENVRKVQKKSQLLPKPLEKPQANRIRRSVAYERACLQLDQWEATITANRVSDNLSFPLNNDFAMDRKESEDFAKMWRVKSKLTKELEKLEPKVEEVVKFELEEFPLTMKELLSRRSEAAKLRAYQSYKEAKIRKQNKIKSKKYHRIQKRERIKGKLKEFEELQKTNPEEALKKLEEIERARVEERFNLRHKGTGKWARNQQIRAKYNKESRQNLAQQLTVSRELTQSSKVHDSGSEEDDAEEGNLIKIDETNPWFKGVKPGQEVKDFVSGYRKFWQEQNSKNETPDEKETRKQQSGTSERENGKKPVEGSETSKKRTQQKKETVLEEQQNQLGEGMKERRKRNKLERHMLKNVMRKAKKKAEAYPNQEENIVSNFDELENKMRKSILNKTKQGTKKKNPKTSTSSIEKRIDLTLPIQKNVPQIDEALTSTTEVTENHKLLKLQETLTSQTKPNEPNIDPHKHLQVSTNLSTAFPDLITEENEENDQQRAIIGEAFEDDNVLEDFHKDKRDEADKSKPKDVNLRLPGWGSWGGTSLKENKRRRRRFIVKAPRKMPRKDDNKGFLIISEGAQNGVKEHLVSEVPFPFKNVRDFEASIRAPISNTFVPETAYRRLIKPVVRTKLGAIIQPIDREMLLNKM